MNSMLRSVLLVLILGLLPASLAMAEDVYPLFGLDDEVLSPLFLAFCSCSNSRRA